MKIKTLISYFFVTLALSSCIQDEALNSEAAIDGCTGADVQLANINADEKIVDVYVHRGANLSKQELIFTLPEGATIKMGNINPPIPSISNQPNCLPTIISKPCWSPKKLLIISFMNLHPARHRIYQKFCSGPAVIRASH